MSAKMSPISPEMGFFCLQLGMVEPGENFKIGGIMQRAKLMSDTAVTRVAGIAIGWLTPGFVGDRGAVGRLTEAGRGGIDMPGWQSMRKDLDHA
jgi:hypothetical protein